MDDSASEPVPVPITDVFDLHTIPPKDVIEVVGEYLLQAHDRGFRYIRIIHGRGIGVQREAVRKVLAGTPFVITFGDAPAEAGGWGATIATLDVEEKDRMPESAVHEELAAIQKQLDTTSEDAGRIIDGLSREQFNWRPEPGSWSAAECFDHLIKVDNLFCRRLAEANAKGRRERVLGDPPFRYSFLPRYFLGLVEPPPKMKFKSPGVFLPSTNHDPAALLDAYRKANRELHRLCGEASGLHLAKLKVGSPAANWWKWPIGIVFAICAAHDRRHLYQARQVRSRMR